MSLNPLVVVGPLTERSAVEALVRFDASRFWRHVQKSDGCWLWNGSTASKGYGAAYISARCYPFVRIYAHRFSWILANGADIPADREICHRCDVPLCVNPEHLFLGTSSDNARDAFSKGRRRSCAVSPLTVEQRDELRRLVAAGKTQAEVGRLFGIHQTTVSFHVHHERNLNRVG